MSKRLDQVKDWRIHVFIPQTYNVPHVATEQSRGGEMTMSRERSWNGDMLTMRVGEMWSQRIEISWSQAGTFLLHAGVRKER